MRVGRHPDGPQSQPILVLNRPPTASFTVGPASPVARELVTLTSSAVDLDGPIVSQQWDLDGDGAYDDASGEKALYFWRRAGTYQVGLRVTDRNGAVAISRTAVVVTAALLEPTPRIRFVGVPTPNGAHLDLLTVVAPKGARVGIRCKGRHCPYKHKRFTSKGKRVNLRQLGRSFPGRHRDRATGHEARHNRHLHPHPHSRRQAPRSARPLSRAGQAEQARQLL